MAYCKDCERAGRGKVKLMRVNDHWARTYYWECPVCHTKKTKVE